MRRRKTIPESPGGLSWLITFSDMVTLLLTFFVLLLSMATMDRSILREISISVVGDDGVAPSKGAGKIPDRYEFVTQLLRNPQSVYEHHRRLKDVLFPDEVLPEHMARASVLDNIEVLVRPEGVAVVLSDGLLFASGQSELGAESQQILSGFVDFLANFPVPVNIAGYTDNIPGRAVDNYALSAERAMSVLSFFLAQDLSPARFSVSAYGEGFPLAENTTPEGRAKNRRVEILLKTSGRTYL